MHAATESITIASSLDVSKLTPLDFVIESICHNLDIFSQWKKYGFTVWLPTFFETYFLLYFACIIYLFIY